MAVAILTLHIQIPICSSLKEKRSRIKPVLARLHREFNLSVAEIGMQDHWRAAVIACAIISNDNAYAQSACQSVLVFFEHNFPDLLILEHRCELV